MPNILKGVFREGTMVASVVQEEKSARIMLKGAEPNMPKDPGFSEALKKVAQACHDHVGKYDERELCAVLVQRPMQAEHVDISPEEIQAWGLTSVSIMDGDSGLVVRRCDTDPLATPLAYASLRGGGSGMAAQPGRVEIPPSFTRRMHKDLTPPQKQVYEVAVQLTGRALMKLVCIDDDGLRLVVAVKDFPPARGRSIIVPLDPMAEEVGKGTAIADVAKKMEILRAG